MMDVDRAAEAMKDAEIEAEIEHFLEGLQLARPTTACGSMGSGCRSGLASKAGSGM
jgi:hypothetical protein